jgi:hypothetical protein
MASRPVSKHPRSPLNRLARAISYQKKTPLSMPLSQRLTALKHGFRSSMYTFYDFARNDPGDYLPDTVFREATNINGAFCQNILRDKLLFTEMLRGTFRVPEVFALLERGNLQPLGEQQTLAELLERHGGLVLKPAGGWQGAGIFNVGVAGATLTVNGRPSTLAALEQQLERLSGYLVTERIVQDGYAHDIFAGSANSIRVVTMQDPDDGHRPFVGVAFHRFGSKTTGPVDNVSRGGLMAHIDPQTGVMGSAIKFPHETGGEMYWSSHHPDTGVPIEGQAIPGWTEVRERLLGLVATYPFFRHVGWDVIVAQGEAWLVEGNHNPSPVGQVFKPYLKDPQIRRFFEYYGVV